MECVWPGGRRTLTCLPGFAALLGPLIRRAVALGSPQANAERIVTVFLHYMEHGGHNITRALFEQNLAEKMGDPEFLADIGPLLSDGYTWDPAAEAPLVARRLIELLPGDPWKRGA